MSLKNSAYKYLNKYFCTKITKRIMEKINKCLLFQMDDLMNNKSSFMQTLKKHSCDRTHTLMQNIFLQWDRKAAVQLQMNVNIQVRWVGCFVSQWVQQILPPAFHMCENTDKKVDIRRSLLARQQREKQPWCILYKYMHNTATIYRSEYSTVSA